MNSDAAPGRASLDHWTRLWQRLGAVTPAEPVYRQLVARYSEPGRAYHTLEHVARCLEELDRHASLAEHPDEVAAALWFHDAVYDTRRNDNEEQSAAWARETLGAAKVAAPVIDRIGRLILVTRHREPPPATDADAALVSDIDLAILGAPRAEYARYQEAIRTEYAWVPEPAFRAARKSVLEGFLARSQIYATRPFAEALEARARENLRGALDALR
ncbi:MAG TPA: hypothetical protein VFL95_02415 [Gemmatimonadales bacterium]|nr:hypothetical protein [Gemmatimonadales bacterium]